MPSAMSPAPFPIPQILTTDSLAAGAAPGLAHCAIALGSNLGDPQRTLRLALDRLSQPPLALLAVAPVYRTAPIGPPQPDYLNTCALVATGLSPANLLGHLLAIEADLGRVRHQRWGPRHLDLDLLLYGAQRVKTPTLEVPHPRMWERPFVLVPLADIAPHWVDPCSGETVAAACRRVGRAGVMPMVLEDRAEN